MNEKNSIWQRDIWLIFPSLVTIVLIFLIKNDLLDMFKILLEEFGLGSLIIFCVISIVINFITASIPLLLITVLTIVGFGGQIIYIPILAIAEGEFSALHLLMFFMGGATVIAAIKAKYFGKYESDSSYVSGSHYEATFQSNGSVKIESVNEYSGGGEWLFNIMRYCTRFYIILIAGIFIFVYVKIKKKIKSTNSKNINGVN